jgi:hypothetical protein
MWLAQGKDHKIVMPGSSSEIGGTCSIPRKEYDGSCDVEQTQVACLYRLSGFDGMFWHCALGEDIESTTRFS